MSNPYILEIKEAYDNSKTTNEELDKHGEFVNTLNKDILIEDGTEVLVRQVFVDSVSKNTNKIEVDEDLTVKMSMVKYWTNNTAATSVNFNYYPTATVPTNEIPDGFDYFECDFSGSATDYYEVEDLWIQAYGSSVFKGMGGVEARFQFTSPNGEIQQGTCKIPSVRARDFTPDGNPKQLPSGDYHKYDSVCKFDTIDGVLTCLNLEDLHKVYIHFGDNNGVGNIYWSNQPTQKTDRGNELQLHTEDFEFTIPANKKGYDPSELARYITDQITDIGEGKNTVSNKYFTTSPLQNGKSQTAFLKPVSECVQSVGGTPKKRYFISTDGRRIAEQKATPTNDTYVGASEIALEWGGDDGVESFRFTAIHTPLYDSSNQSKTFLSQVFEAGNSGKYFVSGRNGGVCFTDLQPVNFWFNKLNFSSDILVQPPTQKLTAGYWGNDAASNPILSSPNGSNVPNLEGNTGNYSGLSNGENMTSNFRGLDTLITATGGMTVPSLLTIKSTTGTTNMIYSKNPFSEDVATDGYFMVEVDLGFGRTEWRGVSQLNYGNKVSAIVNRYYATDTYTSANTEASIPFMYKGEPTRLSQVRVCITDSQGNKLYNDIGDDNTVFIEIVPPNPNLVKK